jgi:type I restriction enzyme S subunit
MRSNYKKLGQFIQQVSIKNSDLAVNNLLGVSITKKFISSIANIIGTDMTTYKIIKKGQFAYGPVTSRNGDKISVALLEDHEAIISTSYTAFEIINTNELLPEYLMMWFRREEFDRYARYMSHGSTREAFGWEEMCDVELPVPSIEKQKELIKEYHTITDRIKLNEQLNQKLEDTAQSIYKEWFINFEFPDENGKPYKSNGGEMVYNDKLDMEIPTGWDALYLNTLYNFQYGKGNNNPDNGGEYPVFGGNGIIGWYDNFNNEDAPVVGHIGINCGSVVYAYGKHFVTYNGVLCFLNNNFGKYFAYSTLLSKDLKQQVRGSSQPFISYDMLNEIIFLNPINLQHDKFEETIKPIFKKIQNIFFQNKNLLHLKDVLLSKMATIEG